jgi:hypothetical protein
LLVDPTQGVIFPEMDGEGNAVTAIALMVELGAAQPLALR